MQAIERRMQRGVAPDVTRVVRHAAQARQRGISLVETMMGIAIMGVALFGYLQMQAQQQDVQLGRTQGEALASAQALLAQYFIANRSEIMSAIAASSAADANVQKHCVIKVANPNAAVNPGSAPGAAGSNGTLVWSGGAAINDGKKTCAFDLSLLQARGMWPAGLSVTASNPETGGAGRWAAIVKRPRAAGPDGIPGNADDVLGEDAQMLIVFADDDNSLGAIAANTWRDNQPLRNRTLAQQEVLGQSGGMVPLGRVGACKAINQSAADAVQACGNGWSVNLSDWIDATQLNALKAVLPSS